MEQVEAFWDPFSAMAGLLYATTDGVGLGSSSQRVRSVFGEPAGRRAEGLLTVWAYHALGLTFGIGNRESPRPETVLTIGILAKR